MRAKELLGMGLIAVAMLGACRQTPPASPASPAATTAPSAAAEEAPAPQTPAVNAEGSAEEPPALTDAQLLGILPQMCNIVTREFAAEPVERPMSERLSRIVTRMEEQAWAPSMGVFYRDEVGDGPLQTRYARMMFALAERGITDWSCDALEAMFNRQAHIMGARPYGEAVMPTEAFGELLCRSAQKPWVMSATTPASRLAMWGFEAQYRVSGPEHGRFFNSLRDVAQAERYQAVVTYLEQNGAPGFTCPPLQTILAGGSFTAEGSAQ